MTLEESIDMDTGQWLVEQEEYARRAKEAYQLLYEVYLDIEYDDYGNPQLTSQPDDKVQMFFRGGY